MKNNMFCDIRDLGNESDVEQSFARRLIEELGYPDRSIRTKQSLERLSSGKLTGDSHKPDFALKVSGHIRWILEAKHPDENLRNHVDQARGYCDAINGAYSHASPVRYFALTNGRLTLIYRNTDTEPFLSLEFGEFVKDNPSYQKLVDVLHVSALTATYPTTSASTLRFTKPGIAEVNNVFAKCHQYIHQADHISQAAGFVEFVKLITLKLLSDKKIKEEYPGLVAEKRFEFPADQVEFSVRWVDAHEKSTANPVNSILFRDFMDDVEKQIAKQIRKRFFGRGDGISLKPETIKGVVERLESLYLFGIDADLNGRLFENFLSATMRGKDLGQFFTPRTLVKLGVGLARLQPSDLVLDGCCGTGGFLIDALADMWSKVNRNDSLSELQKTTERQAIADERIFGIDFAKDPNLAKIARLNMFLHGDGGSRIFNVDSLDLTVCDEVTDTEEEAVEKAEFRRLALAGRFDVVLTNPPFSKKYERGKAGDAYVLDQYNVAVGRQTVLAKLMFFEMYHHYLKPGGRLVSVIDDGFLNAPSYRWFRDTLRKLYTVKAVISLPGDAFQRSEARVKTSFVVLEKRHDDDPYSQEHHPSVFMYACRYVGIDDPKRVRWMPGDDELRANAKAEVAEAVREFKWFLNGEGTPSYIVPANRVRDRLDVKHCLIEHNRRSLSTSRVLEDVVQPKAFDDEHVIDCRSHDSHEQSLIIRYNGTTDAGPVILPKTDTRYPHLFRVEEGDIVVSNIAATYGSVAVVPADQAGLVVSKEYTVLTVRPHYDARVVCALLRSPEIRAEMLLRATGANRTRVHWSNLRNIAFPYPDAEAAGQFIQHIESAASARARAEAQERSAIAELNTALSLDQEQAHLILDAFKPPK